MTREEHHLEVIPYYASLVRYHIRWRNAEDARFYAIALANQGHQLMSVQKMDNPK